MTQGYTTKARFWDYPGAPLVTLIWYPTNLPFLDFPTVFGSHEWETDYVDLRGLGEVRRDKPARKNWHPGIPGLTGDHVCGTPEQFIYGAPDYTGPPIEYDRDHIPLCCGRGNVSFVKAGARPASTLGYHHHYTARVKSGARPHGSPHMVYRPLSRVKAGARPASTVEIIPAPDHPVTAGARPASTVEIIPAPDHPVTAGARPASYSAIVLSCPAPANSCSGAAPSLTGIGCHYSFIATGSGDNWRAWATVPGVTYRWQISWGTSDPADWSLMQGADCSSSTLIAMGHWPPTAGDVTFTATSERVYAFWTWPVFVLQGVDVSLDRV